MQESVGIFAMSLVCVVPVKRTAVHLTRQGQPVAPLEEREYVLIQQGLYYATHPLLDRKPDTS
jgi:hypothetical protein